MATPLYPSEARGTGRSEALIQGAPYTVPSEARLWYRGKLSRPISELYSMSLKHCVYVLQSQKDQNLYVGYTIAFAKRLKNHAEGGTMSTRFRRPLRLIHAEYYFTKSDAVRREKYFKTTKGKRTLRVMLCDYFSTLN
jgi:putative endonuclease